MLEVGLQYNLSKASFGSFFTSASNPKLNSVAAADAEGAKPLLSQTDDSEVRLQTYEHGFWLYFAIEDSLAGADICLRSGWFVVGIHCISNVCTCAAGTVVVKHWFVRVTCLVVHVYA